jgi:hypothetical protein
MSKELEALKLLKPKDEDCYEVGLPDPNEIAYEYLLKYLTPPTADEVCEVLKKNKNYKDKEIFMYGGGFFVSIFDNSDTICEMFDDGTLVFYSCFLTTSEINLISRFYMGVE